MSSTTTILVVGATGKQGGQAIATLLEEGTKANLSLKFITRNTDSASAQALAKRGAKPIKADLFHSDLLEAALTNVDRAFLVTDAGAGEEREALQGKTFIDAAKATGVKHIVFSSVSDADKATDVPHFRSKYEVCVARTREAEI